jgi:hypothetical protein
VRQALGLDPIQSELFPEPNIDANVSEDLFDEVQILRELAASQGI